MDILRALGGSERPVEEVAQGLDVVCALLRNIAREPAEPRFRRVRRGNARIAALLGREEEGLLRAAGFRDAGAGDEDALVLCPGDGGGGGGAVEGRERAPGAEASVADSAPATSAALLEVLGAAEAACAALRQQLRDSAAEPAAARPANGGGAHCHDPAVATALECALLDHVAQRSAETAEAEKRQRRAAEAEALRSPQHWREALCQAGGTYLCDGGCLEAWLDHDADNRSLTHALLELQAAAMRWYGQGARQHCEAWQRRLLMLSARAAAAGEARMPQQVAFGQLLSEELRGLREALFSFPERPGAAPALFRGRGGREEGEAEPAAGSDEGLEGTSDCAVVAVVAPAAIARGAATVVALE